jgi:selenocysteine lyase/cysteine desulfurase
VATIHAHAKALQQSFLQKTVAHPHMGPSSLVVPADEVRRGNFLTFETPDAQAIYRDLQNQHVVTDVRGNRLRIGFGIYQTLEEVEELAHRIEQTPTIQRAEDASTAA